MANPLSLARGLTLEAPKLTLITKETPPEELLPFFDRDGRLARWPSRKRQAERVAVLKFMVAFFDEGRRYREVEVNEILKSRMTYADHVLIRRELCDGKFLERRNDGSEYWRSVPSEGSK